MEGLIEKINKIYPLSPEQMEHLLPAWSRHDLPKGHVILKDGDVCEHLHYVWHGGIRCFSRREEKEITEWISLDDTFFYPPISLFQQKPSRLCIHTLEPTVLYVIKLKDFDKLGAEFHAIERFFRFLLMDGIVAGERRIESLMGATAHDRYIHLTTRYPDLVKRVPLSYIASYMSVTQETLSRIRGIKTII